MLLMKFAGLDGAIIDWYGTRDFHDYARNHRNTQRFIPWLKRAGLKFAICYEDQAVGRMVGDGATKADEAKMQAQADLQLAERHWFDDESYARPDGRPILLVFGPQYFQCAQWDKLRTGLASRPRLYSLPHRAKEMGADGVFGRPPVEGGKTPGPAQWRKELDAP